MMIMHADDTVFDKENINIANFNLKIIIFRVINPKKENRYIN